MAEQDSKKQSRKKTPTALKRIKQSKVKYMRSRSFKSRVRTAIRAFKIALSEKDQEKTTVALNSVYSLMDKGVKIGIYKKNKAARDKSRFALLKQA